MAGSDFKKAFYSWYVRHGRADADRSVIPFLDIGGRGASLSLARQALNLSQEAVAQRLQMPRQNYARLEQAEQSGRLRLDQLSRLAAGMDCELVYSIRPKECICFAQTVWRQVLEKAQAHPWYVTRPANKKAAALAYAARYYMENSKFRAAQGWSERFEYQDFALPPDRIVDDLGY